jgi:hypothetical protein
MSNEHLLVDPGYIYDEDVFSKDQVEKYKKIFMNMPYYMQETVGAETDGLSGIDTDQTQDGLILLGDKSILGMPSLSTPILSEILNSFADKYKIRVDKFLRVRVNLTVKNSDQRTLPIHTDLNGRFGGFSFMYYINDSEGPTTLYNKMYDGKKTTVEDLSIIKEIHPKAGACAIFYSDRFHSWSYPHTSQFRLSANVNFTGEFL